MIGGYQPEQNNDPLCNSYHNCSNCGEMTLCETYHDQCPWYLAARDGLDGNLAGAVCLNCMHGLLLGIQQWESDYDDQC